VPLMPNGCAKSPFVDRGAPPKEAHLCAPIKTLCQAMRLVEALS
jgi:hypothetical protein